MYRNTRGEGFGAECKRRIMLGTYVLSAGYYDAYYLKAQKVRRCIARDFAQGVRRGGRYLSRRFRHSRLQAGREDRRSAGDVPVRHLYDHRQLAGIPCMSVPCGTTAGGAAGGHADFDAAFRRAGMFRLADAFEKAGGASGGLNEGRRGAGPPNSIIRERRMHAMTAPYALPALPYAYDALEPHIDARPWRFITPATTPRM
jgi:aspartyl-tRNA(Asn)/glutamyl-tRNA(Gln) amidotransferase subunit A